MGKAEMMLQLLQNGLPSIWCDILLACAWPESAALLLPPRPLFCRCSDTLSEVVKVAGKIFVVKRRFLEGVSSWMFEAIFKPAFLRHYRVQNA